MIIKKGEEILEIYAVDNHGRILSDSTRRSGKFWRLPKTIIPKEEWYRPRWMEK